MPRAKPSLSYIKSYDADRENVEAARSCTSVLWHSDAIHFCQWHSAITQTQLRTVIQYVSIKVINLANVNLIWKVFKSSSCTFSCCEALFELPLREADVKVKTRKKNSVAGGQRAIFTSVSLPVLRNRTGLSPEQDFRICFTGIRNDNTSMYRILLTI